MSARTPDQETDFRERLASIRRCIPHMVDNGGIWPRDVEWLVDELEAARRAPALDESGDARLRTLALHWRARDTEFPQESRLTSDDAGAILALIRRVAEGCNA